VLKVWHDAIDDRRGNRPLDPADILTPKTAQDFAPDSLGILTHPVDIPGWERQILQRFSFLADLNDDENGGRNAIPGTAAKSTPRSPQDASPATRSRQHPAANDRLAWLAAAARRYRNQHNALHGGNRIHSRHAHDR
jgi:hypothetical protein